MWPVASVTSAAPVKPHICQHVKIIGVDANGAFAEFVKIPNQISWKIDPGIPADYASVLDPLGNAVHTVLAGEIAGQDGSGDRLRTDWPVLHCRGRACGASESFRAGNQ